MGMIQLKESLEIVIRYKDETLTIWDQFVYSIQNLMGHIPQLLKGCTCAMQLTF